MTLRTTILLWILLVMSSGITIITLWAIYDATRDFIIVKRERQPLVRVATFNLLRHFGMLFAHGLLLFIAVTYLLDVARPVRGWIVLFSFYDYPLITLGTLIYERYARHVGSKR